MNFAIIAHDATDAAALERRMAARPAHVAKLDELAASGEALIGAALLSDDDTMMGSILIVDFPSRAALDEYLSSEPYVTENVWGDVTVIPCRLGPSFVKDN